MATIFGFPLLPLWIMGAPLLAVLFSLALPAPRANTIPHPHRGLPGDDRAAPFPRT